MQREFDPRSFGVLVSLITAINQITYAFGPGVVGLLRDLSGSYALPFYGCIAVELTAAVLIMICGTRAKISCKPRMERSEIRGPALQVQPSLRALHPGYEALRFPLPQQILQIQPLREHRRAIRPARAATPPSAGRDKARRRSRRDRANRAPR